MHETNFPKFPFWKREKSVEHSSHFQPEPVNIVNASKLSMLRVVHLEKYSAVQHHQGKRTSHRSYAPGPARVPRFDYVESYCSLHSFNGIQAVKNALVDLCELGWKVVKFRQSGGQALPMKHCTHDFIDSKLCPKNDTFSISASLRPVGLWNRNGFADFGERFSCRP